MIEFNFGNKFKPTYDSRLPYILLLETLRCFVDSWSRWKTIDLIYIDTICCIRFSESMGRNVRQKELWIKILCFTSGIGVYGKKDINHLIILFCYLSFVLTYFHKTTMLIATICRFCSVIGFVIWLIISGVHSCKNLHCQYSQWCWDKRRCDPSLKKCSESIVILNEAYTN